MGQNNRRRDQEAIRRLLRRAETDDEGISRLEALNDLREHTDALVEMAVLMARRQGRTWEEIGEALDMAKQSAWERFRELES